MLEKVAGGLEDNEAEGEMQPPEIEVWNLVVCCDEPGLMKGAL